MERTFGVEIEGVGMSVSQAARVLGNTGLRGWTAVADSSLRGGFEVVSPILRGEDGLRQVKTVADALNEAGADANRRCGLHVHIGADRLTAAQMIDIVKRYADNEEEIDSLMPHSRRGNSATYCRSVKNMELSGSTPTEVVRSAGHDRYKKVNLKSFVKHGTVEFRHHSGTVNAAKITNWVRFLQSFVKASENVASTASVQHLHRVGRMILEQDGNMSVDEIAGALEMTRASVQSAVSRMRRQGVEVSQQRCRGRSTYRIAVMAPSSLWDGVDASVKSFYETRKAALAAA